MYEDITIKQFMRCWFSEDFTEISKENFEIIYTEYIDATGLFSTREFELVSYIHYLNNRVNSVKLSVSLQKQFFEEFNEPYKPAFPFLRKFGHRIKWSGNKEDFYNQLDKIIKKNSKFEIELNAKQKELIEERKKHNSGEPDKKQTRVEFIKMLNTLCKIGFKIDKNETTVEELALMVKQQFDESEAIKNKSYG